MAKVMLERLQEYAEGLAEANGWEDRPGPDCVLTPAGARQALVVLDVRQPPSRPCTDPLQASACIAGSSRLLMLHRPAVHRPRQTGMQSPGPPATVPCRWRWGRAAAFVKPCRGCQAAWRPSWQAAQICRSAQPVQCLPPVQCSLTCLELRVCTVCVAPMARAALVACAVLVACAELANGVPVDLCGPCRCAQPVRCWWPTCSAWRGSQGPLVMERLGGSATPWASCLSRSGRCWERAASMLRLCMAGLMRLGLSHCGALSGPQQAVAVQARRGWPGSASSPGPCPAAMEESRCAWRCLPVAYVLHEVVLLSDRALSART